MAGPVGMTRGQMGDYLNDLRNNRPSRPSLNGTRSPPPSTLRSWRGSVYSTNTVESDGTGPAHGRTSRSSSRLSYCDNAESLRSGRCSPTKSNRLSMQESFETARERRESRRISRQLDGADLEDEETMMAAAKAEAEDLILQCHRTGVPFQLPREERVIVEDDLPRKEFKKPLARRSIDLLRRLSVGKDSTQTQSIPSEASESVSDLKPKRSLRRLSQKLSISGMSHRRRSNTKRNISGEIQHAPFPNENQKIYEDDPADIADLISAYGDTETALPAMSIKEDQHAHVRRNPFARARQSVSLSPDKSRKTQASSESSRWQPRAIQQPREASLALSREPSQSSIYVNKNPELQPNAEDEVRYRDGKEIRSDDIRAATSMRKKDRSPRLPAPTAVSDKPDRPIVSFDPNWKPPQLEDTGNTDPRDSPSNVTLPVQQSKGSPPIEQTFVPSSKAPHHPSMRAGVERPNKPSEALSRHHHQAPEHARAQPSRSLRAESGTTPSINVTHDLAGEPGPTVDISPPEEGTKGSHLHKRASESDRQRPSTSINNVQQRNPGCETSLIPEISCTPAGSDEAAQGQSSLPTLAFTTTKETAGQSSKTGSAPRGQPRREQLLSKPHWTPGMLNRAALCSQCALPISGRVVTAAGARFHPECFACHHCGEALECVAFYPEPAQHRAMREERNELRDLGETVEQPPGTTEADDADDSLRFYCHLDFHEMFSPRCKTCKTPIEGQVIAACGAEYHPGHFFCAQCGDPFDPSTPFVEKDGYAWCVNCHTNRYSAKCRKCRKPITEMVLNALGTEWHESCFTCTECDGQFTDGRYFLRGESMAPVCFSCEERRLKA